MIIDVHNHIGLSLDGGHGTIDELLKIMDENKIEKSVLFATDEEGWKPNFKEQNSKMMNVQKRYADRIVAFVRVVPSTGDLALQELKRCCDLGAKGLKLKPVDGFHPKEAEMLFDAIKDKENFPVLIHTSHSENNQPKLWEEAILKYPQINFILAHGGKADYKSCAEIAKKYDNVYVDTSTLSYHRSKWIYNVAGAKKLIFASDYPYSHPEVEIVKHDLIVRDKSERNVVYFKNAQKILNV